MTLLPTLCLIRSLEISVSGAALNDTPEGRGSATLSKNEHSVNVWGISTRVRSAVSKSMMPFSRAKESLKIFMKNMLQKKFWKKQLNQLKRISVTSAVGPSSQ